MNTIYVLFEKSLQSYIIIEKNNTTDMRKFYFYSAQLNNFSIGIQFRGF